MWHAGPRERGTIARPAPSMTEIPDEEPTNGLDEFFSWDDIEESLSKGEFAYKSEFKSAVRRQFEQADVEFDRPLYESVIAGLFPEARETYRTLPSTPPNTSATSAKLTVDLVKEIRERAGKGEKALHLAKEYGVRHNTVSDLINRKTWRNVA